MRSKSVVLLLFVLLAGGLGLAIFAAPGTLSLGGVPVAFGERGWLVDRTRDFLEDIQFKDFDHAATYHLAEKQTARDIPALIRRVFQIKHEVLDIKDFEILEVDLDRSGRRARVRTKVDFHVLGPSDVRDAPESSKNVEMLFYWFKGADGQWTMDLESSL